MCISEVGAMQSIQHFFQSSGLSFLHIAIPSFIAKEHFLTVKKSVVSAEILPPKLKSKLPSFAEVFLKLADDAGPGKLAGSL